MAYARFGSDCDVYVFKDLCGEYLCFHCLNMQGQNYHTFSLKTLETHLRFHQYDGHKVPDHVFWRIHREMAENNKGVQDEV